MNLSDISEIVAGLVIGGRVAASAVDVKDLEPPYDKIVKLRQQKKDDMQITMEVGMHPMATIAAAAERIPAKADVTTYLKMLEQISLRVEVGNRLLKEAKKLVQGEEVGYNRLGGLISQLDTGLREWTTMDKVEPEANMWEPTGWWIWDDYFGGVPKYGLIIVGAPPGCLTGDTVVGINRGGKSFNIRLDQLYHRFNGGKAGGKVWRDDIPTMIRARYDDGTVRLVRLQSALDSGMKKVWELKTQTHTIRGTWDHPVLTEAGWVKLSLLKPGDLVYVDGGQTSNGHVKTNYLYKEGLKYHPFAGKVGSHRYALPLHRIVYEARFNHMELAEFIEICRTDPVRAKELRYVNPYVYAIHHVDMNPRNNELDNLVMLSHSSHALLHSEKSKANVLYHTVLEPVVSVTEGGIEHTYDLSLASDPHNFVANGIVVHNTGKTTLVLKLIDHKTRAKKDGRKKIPGKPVAMLSLELPNGILLSRLIQTADNLTDEQRKLIRVTDEQYDIDEATSAITRLVMINPEVEDIFVDFADLLVPSAGEESTEMAGKIYRNLAALAKTLRKRIFLISQLNSNYVGGRPRVNHIRWSRLAEAVASMVVLLYNPDQIDVNQGKNDKDNKLPYMPDKAYIILGKSRFGYIHDGRTGAVQVDWLGQKGWGDESAVWFQT